MAESRKHKRIVTNMFMRLRNLHFFELDKGAVVTVLQKTYRLNGHRCHQILTQDGQMGWLDRLQGDDEIQPPHDWITKKLKKNDEARKTMSRQEYQTWLRQGKILPDIILKIATPIVAPLVIIGILICIFLKCRLLPQSSSA